MIVSIVGLVATAAALVKAGSRLRDLWQDHKYALVIVGPDQNERLEILMTKNLYRGQMVRFSTYAAMMVIFAMPFAFRGEAQEQLVLVRTVLVLYVLFSFAAEEFYLDRARDRWLSSIRKARHEGMALTKQDEFIVAAEENQAALQEQQNLVEEQTNLTTTAQVNRRALRSQRGRRRGKGNDQ